MSERYEAGLSQAEVETRIEQLGSIGQRAVIVGSAAVQAAFPQEWRSPQDIDLSVGIIDYWRLRFRGPRAGWQKSHLADGRRRLTNQAYDVSIGWGGTAHGAIQRRAWRLDSGQAVAGLPDVYAYKQERSDNKDIQDAAFIRERLLDPGQPPLPAQLLERQMELVARCLPERLRNHPDAQPLIRLAANGMFIVHTLYGDPEIRRANQIIGKLERPEYGVSATYHNGFDLHEGLYVLVDHLEQIGASDREILLAVIADCYADAVYGNGRHRDNPDGHDELLSAQLVYSHAIQSGLPRAEAQRLHDIVLDTTFDEVTMSQRGKHSRDPLARAVVGIDTHILSSPQAVVGAMDVGVENLLSARFDARRPLGGLVAKLGLRIHFGTTPQALRFIDKYKNEVPEGYQEPIKQVLANFVIGNADFHQNYEPPHDWQFDVPELRQAHAAMLRYLGERLLRDQITAGKAYRLAHRHARRMRRVYGLAA